MNSSLIISKGFVSTMKNKPTVSMKGRKHIFIYMTKNVVRLLSNFLLTKSELGSKLKFMEVA